MKPPAATLDSPVRFDPALLGGSVEAAVKAFAGCVSGFARRLEPRDRARFLMALDGPLYDLQGAAAIDADGGLHPKHRLMRYHDFFVEHIGADQRVIDLGCGNGALACAIATRSFAQVLGVDWNEANLVNARARARDCAAASAMFVPGDIVQDRQPGAFDVVVLSNVLEHLADRPQLLRKYAQWYRPRTFLIRVPAFDREWRVPFKKELGVEWRLDLTHETEYTEAQLRAEITHAGLSVESVQARWGEYWAVVRAA